MLNLIEMKEELLKVRGWSISSRDEKLWYDAVRKDDFSDFIFYVKDNKLSGAYLKGIFSFSHLNENYTKDISEAMVMDNISEALDVYFTTLYNISPYATLNPVLKSEIRKEMDLREIGDFIDSWFNDTDTSNMSTIDMIVDAIYKYTNNENNKDRRTV